MRFESTIKLCDLRDWYLMQCEHHIYADRVGLWGKTWILSRWNDVSKSWHKIPLSSGTDEHGAYCKSLGICEDVLALPRNATQRYVSDVLCAK